MKHSTLLDLSARSFASDRQALVFMRMPFHDAHRGRGLTFVDALCVFPLIASASARIGVA